MRRDTQERLLDAAEKLFANADVGGVSLRRVAREADVNPALVHYHFGSQDGLLEAVILRRLEVIQKRRRQLLDSVRLRDRPQTVRDLVEVVVLPLSEIAKQGRKGRAYLKLSSRLAVERSGLARELSMRHFADIFSELRDCFGEVLPHVPPEIRARRLTLSFRLAYQSLAAPVSSTGTHGEQVAELVDFLAGGLSANPSACDGSSVRRTGTR